MLGTSLELGKRHHHLDTERYLKASIGTINSDPQCGIVHAWQFFETYLHCYHKTNLHVYSLSLTLHHMRGADHWPPWPGSSACSPQLKSEENQEQCSVFSVQCPGVERAVNTGRGNVPDRPDTRRERTRRLEFNLLFIETQLEWEFEVRDGWMLDCSITWTNFMALLGWNEDKAGRVRNM